MNIKRIESAMGRYAPDRYLVMRPGGAIVGMLEKYKNTRTEIHPWKAFLGVGGGQTFLGAFYADAGGKRAAIAAIAEGRSLRTGQPNALVFQCSKCGKELFAHPGYERATWRHCPCGHVAIRKEGV